MTTDTTGPPPPRLPEVVGEAIGQLAIPMSGTALFQWDYDSHDEQLLRLYRQGKQRQWDADETLDWDHQADPENPLGLPDEFLWLAGSALWDRLPPADRVRVRTHSAGWMYSQFLHSEQFALLAVGKISQTVPALDAKLFVATQLMDEARHAEAFNRYLSTKIGVRYGLSASLASLFDQIMREGRWDFACLAGHVIVENMGLAAFGQQRTQLQDPFARAFAGYVARDEARHVAFGRIVLRRYYPELSESERREREEFALEACWSLRDRFVGEEMWAALDYGAEECADIARRSPAHREFRRQLFMRVVPALREIGLFSPRMQDGLAKMGVLGFGKLAGPDARYDDDAVADVVDQRELTVRQRDIEATAQLGAAEPPKNSTAQLGEAEPANSQVGGRR